MARDEGGQFSDVGDQAQAVGAHLSWKPMAHPAQDRTAMAADYEENEGLDTRFRDAARHMHFFCVDFDDVRLMRKLVYALADAPDTSPGDVWIDTDYG